MYDQRRVEGAVLALMHPPAQSGRLRMAGMEELPVEATDGLHERGLIGDPRSKAKPVALTDEGAQLAEQLFTERFGVEGTDAD